MKGCFLITNPLVSSTYKYYDDVSQCSMSDEEHKELLRKVATITPDYEHYARTDAQFYMSNNIPPPFSIPPHIKLALTVKSPSIQLREELEGMFLLYYKQNYRY